MHATLHRRPFSRPGWVFEDKLDGFRAFARKSGDRIELLSRHGRSMAKAFPEICRALAAMPVDAVLDAELVVPDEKMHPSWEQLRQRAFMSRPDSIARAVAQQPAALCVFDCLAFDGRDMRTLPLLERKAALTPLIRDTPGLQVVTHLESEGETAFAAAVAFGLEGIVAKQADSPYVRGRQTTWLKIKNADYYRQEALGFRN